MNNIYLYNLTLPIKPMFEQDYQSYVTHGNRDFGGSLRSAGGASSVERNERLPSVGSGGGSALGIVYDYLKDKWLNKRPSDVNTLLKNHGTSHIYGIEICRKPVTSIIQKTLNVLTFGSFKRRLKKLNYDDVFHLWMIVHLGDGTVWSIEKNERVRVVQGKIKGGECRTMTYDKKTLGEFINETEENVSSEQLWRYDAFSTNCQRFVYDLMNSNGISHFNEFILQNAESLAPSLFQKFAKKITDAAGFVNYIFKGGNNKY